MPNIGHKAPIPLGARVGNLICSSGIAGKDPATGALPADGAAQTANAFANLQALLLAAGGATLADVVRKLSVYAERRRAARRRQHPLAAQCFPDPDDRPARHITRAARCSTAWRCSSKCWLVVQWRVNPPNRKELP